MRSVFRWGFLCACLILAVSLMSGGVRAVEAFETQDDDISVPSLFFNDTYLVLTNKSYVQIPSHSNYSGNNLSLLIYFKLNSFTDKNGPLLNRYRASSGQRGFILSVSSNRQLTFLRPYFMMLMRIL